VFMAVPSFVGVLGRSPEDLPSGRPQVRDRHLNFHKDRDNLNLHVWKSIAAGACHSTARCQAAEAHRSSPTVCGYAIAAVGLARISISDKKGILLVSKYHNPLWRRQGRRARRMAASGFTPWMTASAPTTPPTRLMIMPSA